MKIKILLLFLGLLLTFPRPALALTCQDPCQSDSDCSTNEYCYKPAPPACPVCKSSAGQPPTNPPLPPSGGGSSSFTNPSPTALRPNPFQLVKEEANKTFSADKDSMTVGVAESPEFNLPIGAITSNFWRFITPFLSSGQTSTGPGAGTDTISCSQPVADRAKTIVDNLQRGFWGYFNKSPDYPELFEYELYAQNPDLEGRGAASDVNMFWCTWLVIKSFSESDASIITPELGTHRLTEFFQGAGRYIDANNITIQDVCPGMAVFFHIPAGSTSNAHVGIVYSVSADGITSVESNAPYKTMFYPTDESGHFQIIGSGDDTDDTIEVSGFGMPWKKNL